LEHLRQEQMEIYDGIMAGPESFLEKTRKLLELKIRTQCEYGEQFLHDLLHTQDAELQEYLAQQQAEGMELAFRWMEQGKAAGVIWHDFRDAFLSYVMLKIVRLVEDEELARIYPDLHERLEAITRFGIYGIMDPDYSGEREGSRST